MLEVVNIRVRGFDLDYIDIYWEIRPTTEDVVRYNFFVDRSDHEHSGYEELAGPFTDAYYIRDTTIRGQRSNYRKWYYRIRVVDTISGQTKTFPEQGGVTSKAEPDLVAREMSRVAQLKLVEYTGRLVWVYPIRTFGQMCTCVDHVTQRKLRTQCPVCFDTKWVGGFHRPIQTYMQIIMPAEATSTSEVGEIQNVNATGFLAASPEVHPRWIVIDTENNRWRIGEGVRRVEKGRALINQTFPLYMIPKGDIEYKLPVSVSLNELLNLNPSPLRLYTNPQDMGVSNEHLLNSAKGIYRS